MARQTNLETALAAEGYHYGAETRHLFAFEGGRSGRMVYVDRSRSAIRLVVPDPGREKAAEALAADAELAAAVHTADRLGSPGWHLAFPDMPTLQTFLRHYDSESA